MSEGDVSASESSCSGTPIVNRSRRQRETLIRTAMKTPRSSAGVERGTEEWEDMIELMRGAYEDLKNAVRRLHLISRKDLKIFELATAANNKADETWGKLVTTLGKKGWRGRRRIERPEEAEVATQTSPLMEEKGKRRGDGRKLASDNGSKRKTVSPLEDKKAEPAKRVRRGDASYAEVCGERRRDEVDPGNKEVCETGGEWTVEASRRERGRVRKEKGVADNNGDGGASLPSEGRGTKVPRMRSRPEAILVEVEEGKEWLKVYREMVVAKEVLKESRAIRRTRAGDILVELKAGSGERGGGEV